MAADSDNKIGENQSLVLFDGVCHFCNNSVNFIIDRDPGKKFVFAPLQSHFARELLIKYGEDPDTIDTIKIIRGSNVYRRSRAALEIARQLNGLWPLCYAAIVIPRFLRDIVYNLIAKNRYKWFGKMDACRIPTPEMRERFFG